MIGSMRAASVAVTYQPQAPERYTARLGRGGWCEGWGWTVPGALADLARVVEDVRPGDLVPADLLADRGGLLRWLEDRAGDVVLGD
jgi:hypothetical protein